MHNTYSFRREEHNGVQSIYTEPYELPDGRGELYIKLNQTSKGDIHIFICITKIMKERYAVLEMSSTDSFLKHKLESKYYYCKSFLEDRINRDNYLYCRPSVLHLKIGNETIKIRSKKVNAESMIEKHGSHKLLYKTQREVWNVCFPIDVDILKKLCESNFEEIDIKAPFWMGGVDCYSENVSLQTDARVLYNLIFDSEKYKDTILNYNKIKLTQKQIRNKISKGKDVYKEGIFEGTHEYNKRYVANIFYFALLIADIILHYTIKSMTEQGNNMILLWLFGYGFLLVIGSVSKVYFYRVKELYFNLWLIATIIWAIYSLFIQI